MSTSAPALPTAQGAAAAPTGRLVITELKLYIRERVGPFWGIVFPLVLLIIFGSIPGFRQPVSSSIKGLSILDAYVPILIAFVLANLAINAMPTTLAGYREKGILRRLATTPAGPLRVLTAQLAAGGAVQLTAVIVLLTVARVAYSVALPRQAVGFALAAILTAAAMLAIGLFIAAVARTGRAANVIGALLFFPMMFFAGLWLPIAAMPAGLRHIAHLTPLGAAAQSLQDATLGSWPHPLYLLLLGGYALVFGALAARLFRWE